MYQSISKTPSNSRILCACLLSFSILITPIAALATPKLTSRPSASAVSFNTKSATEESNVNPPPVASTITATMADSIENDDADNKIDPTNGSPGTTEKITYTATITNAGPDPATGVVFTDTIDTHTALIPGSVFVSPLAINDSYNSVGNMTLDSNVIGGSCGANTLWSVVCNDTLNGGTLTGFGQSQGTANGTTPNGSNTITTTNGGTVLLRTDGTFLYNPVAGFEGTDTFWYTLRNSSASPALTDTGQVSIAVGGANGMVWFITSAGGGTGRQANPFSLAAFNTVNTGAGTNPSNGDTVFLFEGAHTGPVTLRPAQKFIGQDATVSVPTLGGPASQPGNTYPGINPTGTTAGINSAGVGITLGSDNNIAGFSVGNSTTAIAGGAVGTLSVREVTINTNGAGLIIATSGIIANNATFPGFTSITTTGGTNGISLTGVNGTLNTTGSLSGASGSTFNVSGGTVSVTYAGNATQASNAPLVFIGGGHNTGTITFQTGTLNATNGTGLQFDNADSTASYNFNGTTTLSGGDAGIDILNGSSGSFNFGSNTSITSPSGTAFNVNASTPTFLSYTGSITANNSRAVSISNAAAAAGCGTQTYSGSINGSGASATGILVNNCNAGTINFSGTTLTLNTQANNALTLTGNAGATINFSGGNQSLTTTNGHGINATGGGNINITGNDNTINTTGSGLAINWAMLTAVHSNGALRFKSINKSGSGAKAILVNFHDGSFTITGDDDNNGTPDSLTAGGTITGTSARGAEFIDVDGGVSLGGMTFTNATSVDGATPADCGNAFQTAGNKNCNAPIYFDLVTNANLHTIDVNGSVQTGIIGYNVSGLTMNSVTARNGGNDIAENGGAAFKNLSGNTSILNSTFRDNTRAQFDITSNAGNVAGNITFLNNEFTGNRAPNLSAQGLLIVNGGTMGTVNIGDGTAPNDNNFHDTFSNGVQYSGNQGATSATININRNSFTNTNSGVVLQVAGVGVASSLDYAIENNTIVAGALTGSGAIITSATQGHILDGLIRNNTIGTSGVANSGAVCNSCNGITVDHDGFGRHDVSIVGNIVQRVKSIGIYYQVADASGNVFITGNLVREPEGNPSNGIFVQSGTLASDNGCVTVTMGGTVNAGFPSTAANAMNSVQGTWDPAGFQSEIFLFRRFATVMNLPGLVGAAAAWVEARNNIPDANGPDVTATATPFGSAASCPLLLELDGISQASDPAGVATSLSREQLNLVVSVALHRWAATGLTSEQLATLRAIKFEITELPGSYLGEADSNRVLIDRNAGGLGWFIDSDALNDTSFARAVSATRRHTQAASASAGRVDLLTTIMHEMGHKLGLKDSYVEQDRNSLMYGYLSVGERRTPAKGQALHARPGSFARPHFLSLTPAISGETVTVNIGTLPAGKSVTITFQVTLNNPPNLTLLTPARVSNQGSVSYAESGTPVLTDDTTVVGSANATETEVDRFDTSINLNSSLNPSNVGEQVTFTATVDETPIQGVDDPTGTVDFIDTSNGNVVICNDVALTAGSAQCQTSSLTPGTLNVRADYSGDGNFDSSQSNLVAQVVVACVTNPIVTRIADTNDGVCDADCSLREAIAQACPGSTITFDTTGVFATPQTINVSSTLVIARNVTIDGPNAAVNKVAVSAGGANFRAFRVDSPVTIAGINDLTVTGVSVTSSSGGGILVQSGTVTLTGMLFTGNTVINSMGGGVAVTGGATLNVRNSTISGNRATHGGGVYNTGSTLNLLNVTVTNNTGDGNIGGGPVGGPGAVGGGVETAGGATNIKNSIVAGNFATTDVDISGAITNQGNNILTGDPGVSALTDNGGPTMTHALLPTSAAVDAGDNTAATTAGLTTDQRGTDFPRIADSADADATATVDIGAFELHPSIENIPDKLTAEDTSLSFGFNLGDGTGALVSTVTASSSNTTLVPNLPANINVTGSGSTRTLDITPALNANTSSNGTATITVTVIATNGQTAQDTFVLTVTDVNDNPDAINDNLSAVDEDSGQRTIPIASLLGNDSAGPGNENGQTLTLTNATNPTGGSVSFDATNVYFTPALNFNGTANFDYTITDNGATNGGADPKSDTAMASFTVNAINDPPTFTIAGNPPAVNEDAGTQTNNAFATNISQGSAGETGQTLTFNITPIGTTGNISFTGGPTIDATTGNLTYTVSADTNGTATFNVTLSDDGSNVSPNSNTSAAQSFVITVNALNDAPTVQLAANPAVNEDAGAQTVNNFASNFEPGPKTATDEVKQILVGYTVTPAGSTGNLTFSVAPAIDNSGTLEYTPAGDTSGTATFNVVATDSGSGTAPNVNQSAPVSFTISVNGLNDSPLNTVPGPQSTNQNTTLIFSSGNANQISVADVDAGANDIQTTLTANNGTLTLNGTTNLNFSVGDGTADPTMTFTGTISNINTALNGLAFTPASSFSGPANVTITISDLGHTGSGGPLSDTDSVSIHVSSNIRVQDGKVVEPPSGSTNMIFTVSLSAPAPPSGVSVNFTTMDEPPAISHATAGQDYSTTTGTLTFAAGEQLKTISVPVLADNIGEANETFLVVLSSPVNGTIADGTATGTILNMDQAGTVLISELRTSGPGGPGDDFVEIYNNSNSPLTITPSDASAGYGVFRMGADCNATPVLIGTIPNGTVIPARGHFLFVGSQYSLANYGGTGAAAGDAMLTSDIESDANVAIFSTADAGNLSTATRLDAVGFGTNTGGNCDLLREGNTLPSNGPTILEGSYQRDQCGKLANSEVFGGCPTVGTPKDSNKNAQDFFWADTAATSSVAGQHLGAPGPENLASPLLRNNSFAALLLDATKGASAAPNRVRDSAPQMPNATQGTLSIRRRYRNDTGGPVTRLRFRIVDISTFPTPGAVADMRALSSLDTVVTNVGDSQTCAAESGSPTAPCTITLRGTTVESPPSQAMGGANNTTLTVTLVTPLPAGASINIQWLLGLQSTGAFKFFINVETLP